MDELRLSFHKWLGIFLTCCLYVGNSPETAERRAEEEKPPPTVPEAVSDGLVLALRHAGRLPAEVRLTAVVRGDRQVHKVRRGKLTLA